MCVFPPNSLIKVTTMKSAVLLLNIFLYIGVYGQNAPEFHVAEERRQMSRGEQNGFMVDIPGASVKNLEEAWSKYYKKNTKAKFSKKGDEFIALNVVGSRIASDTVNIFLHQTETKEGVKLYSFVEYGDHFISGETDHEKAVVIQNIMVEIARDTYRIVVGNELGAEQKKLKALQKEYDDLIKANEKMHKTITANQAEIGNKNVQVRNLEAQLGKSFDRDEDGNLIPIPAPAPLDDKTRKSLEKNEKKLRSDIHKLESGIRQAERDIPRNQQDQEAKLAEVTAQVEVVKGVQARLNAIP